MDKNSFSSRTTSRFQTRMWLSKLVLVCVMVAAAWAAAVDLSEPLEKDEIIEAVNNAKTTWTAGRNFHSSLKKSYLNNLLGTKRRPGGSRLPTYVPDQSMDNIPLPDNFDLRTQYPNCTGLNSLRDQGACSSSWAVAATSTFTDRLCIASKGKWNSQLSAQNVLSCCTLCSWGVQGCAGGYTDEAWIYFAQNGIVSGGDYKSKEGCQPFTLPTCEHYISGPRKDCKKIEKPTPKCSSKCYNKSFKTPFSKDIHKVTSPWVTSDVTSVMKDIYKNGPVEATFDVFEDFLSYKSGIYNYVTGALVGGHSVKIVGWGVEQGNTYWLVANSWNSDWGDHGYFKIHRGNDTCGFEDDMRGGIPVVDLDMY